MTGNFVMALISSLLIQKKLVPNKLVQNKLAQNHQSAGPSPSPGFRSALAPTPRRPARTQPAPLTNPVQAARIPPAAVPRANECKSRPRLPLHLSQPAERFPAPPDSEPIPAAGILWSPVFAALPSQ